MGVFGFTKPVNMKETLRNDLLNLSKELVNQGNSWSSEDWLAACRILHEKALLYDFMQKNTSTNEQTQVPATESTPVNTGQKVISLKTEKQTTPINEAVEKRSTNKVTSVSPADLPPVGSTADQEVVEKKNLIEKAMEMASPSLNEKLSASAPEPGLNDRIAFVSHLFNSKQEDFNRVWSQLNTFETIQEAEDFIALVKSDYDWSEKEEYEERLMSLLRKKFD